jgi:hypothetical protein
MPGGDGDYVDARITRITCTWTLAMCRCVCAFWIGHNLLLRGETVRATGWLARAAVARA